MIQIKLNRLNLALSQEYEGFKEILVHQRNLGQCGKGAHALFFHATSTEGS